VIERAEPKEYIMNYYDTPIKDVIAEVPKLGDLLAFHGVDCVTCKVGTCLLKDVLNIHNFTEDKKKEIMVQIDKVINGEDIEISPIGMGNDQKAAGFCKPIQELVDEHKNILRLLDLGQYIAGKKSLDDRLIEVSKKLIFFVRNYADKYHHAKEEKILFTKVDANTDVIKVMLSEHETGRNFMRLAMEGIESNNQEQTKEALLGYVELLRQHIRKEDKILYPWFEKILSEEQKADIQREFMAVDLSLDRNISGDLLKFLVENYC